MDGDNHLLRWGKPLDKLIPDCSGKILSIQLDIGGGSLGKSKAEDINLGVFSIKRLWD